MDTIVTLKENEILEALNYEIDVPVLCSGIVMILSTDKFQPQVRVQWDKN